MWSPGFSPEGTSQVSRPASTLGPEAASSPTVNSDPSSGIRIQGQSALFARLPRNRISPAGNRQSQVHSFARDLLQVVV